MSVAIGALTVTTLLVFPPQFCCTSWEESKVVWPVLFLGIGIFTRERMSWWQFSALLVVQVGRIQMSVQPFIALKEYAPLVYRASWLVIG